MITYIAFLRGINVGGRSIIRMEDLRLSLENMGFTKVRTLLNSGNALFTTDKTNKETLREEIEAMFKQAYGREIFVMLRSEKEIQVMLIENPFESIQATSKTHLYVTFFSKVGTSSLKIPYESTEKDFKILRVTREEVYCMLTLSENRKTPDLMKVIGKEFGSKNTTRNWNTIIKLEKLLQ